MQDKLAQIQNLKIKYRNSFSAKKMQLDDYIKLIKQSQKDLESTNKNVLIDLYEYMHNLSGSSGMYDYSDITKLAREVMPLCKNNDGKSVDTKIIGVMSQLSNLLEHHIKG